MDRLKDNSTAKEFNGRKSGIKSYSGQFNFNKHVFHATVVSMPQLLLVHNQILYNIASWLGFVTTSAD